MPEGELRYFRPLADEIRNGRVIAGEWIFYPYKDGRLLLKSETALQRGVPWFYSNRLLPEKPQLLERGSLRARKWWELAEPRGTWLDKQVGRILSPAFGQCGSFAYDPQGQYAVAQGSAWLWRSGALDEELGLAYLAFLNSYEFEALLELLCARIGGGQYQLYRADLTKVPLPDLSKVRGQVRRELANAGHRVVEGHFDPLAVGGLVSRMYGVEPGEFLRLFGLGKAGALHEKFTRLAAQWKEETSHLSNLQQRMRHPAHQEILAMGRAAIPLLIRELVNDPDDWFCALEELTGGGNPIPEEFYGDFERMTEAWIQWGRDKGYG